MAHQGTHQSLWKRLGVPLLCVAGMNLPSLASTYWFQGVHHRDIEVCFAGNAVTQRPARIREIVGHLQHFQNAANIRFYSPTGNPIAVDAGTGGNVNNLACPAPATLPNGNSYYAGDIRVALWNTDVPLDPPGWVPGVGCTQVKESFSWANPPAELELKRSCQYNLKLGDDDLDTDTNLHTGVPWLNHTLHEFGHALGLVHEFVRADIDPACGVTGTWTDGWITASWDRYSVMNYVMLGCQAYANYANTGLSAGDKLALHMMYPEDQTVAEFWGRTVIGSTENLQLQALWKYQGAYMNFVAGSFQWSVDGTVRSTVNSMSLAGLAAGSHSLSIAYTDFLGRNYLYNGTARVSSATQLKANAALMQDIQDSLLNPVLDVYLPLIIR